jgi:transcriptional regulator with XRE-family HTH domain
MSALSLANFLRERMVLLKLSNSSVARRACISRPTWYALLNAETNEAKLTTIVKLANALETHPMILMSLYFEKNTFPVIADKKNYKYARGFIADVTYPTNSLVYINSTFSKTWRVVNLSQHKWAGVSLQCIDKHGEDTGTNEFMLQPALPTVMLPDTPSGETVDITVHFKAPSHLGTVISYWKAIDSNGIFIDTSFGVLHCIVRVVSVQ